MDNVIEFKRPIKPIIRVTKWSIGKTFHSNEVLYATTCDEHPRFPVGERIQSSRIIHKDEKNKVIETLRTIYILD